MPHTTKIHVQQLLAIAALVVLLLIRPASAADEEFWNVRKSDFHCLMANLSAYKAVEDDQVIIFLSSCPETDTDVALGMLSKNQIISDVDKVEDNAITPAEVITLTLKQIACLEGQQFDQTGSIIQLPRNPCNSK